MPNKNWHGDCGTVSAAWAPDPCPFGVSSQRQLCCPLGRHLQIAAQGLLSSLGFPSSDFILSTAFCHRFPGTWDCSCFLWLYLSLSMNGAKSPQLPVHIQNAPSLVLASYFMSCLNLGNRLGVPKSSCLRLF